MEEEWRDISGFEGLYQVSNLGNVKSLNRVIIAKDGKKHFLTGQIIKSDKCGLKYCQLNLFKNSKRKKALVHRLVAIALIDNPENKRCVNHIDSNGKNNNILNLEWLTHKENTAHGIIFGNIRIRGIDNKTSKLNNNDVINIRNLYNNEKMLLKEIARIYKMNITNIHDIIKNKTWKHVKN